MRKLLSLLFGVFVFNVFVHAQDSVVSWMANLEKTSESEYTLHLKALIKKQWRLYADNSSLDVPAPHITLEAGTAILTGRLEQHSVAKSLHDPVFSASAKGFEKEAVFLQKLRLTGDVFPLVIRIESFCSDGKSFVPLVQEVKLELPGKTVGSIKPDLLITNIDAPLAACGKTTVAGKGWFSVFLLGIGGGLLALLTPCVFPMVPVTVSFFTNKSKNKQQAVRNGLLYGIFILAIYILASVPFHLADEINPQLLNAISTNAWVNLFFFAVFILFALSFFGLFEITLPSRFVNSTGSKGGIFFMALTLVLVSFSCTGPILGSLLVSQLSGGANELTAGMAGFGVALALPFGLFAMFPQWLKRLPKSGGWMETFKKVLAFVELALALKFLSNADLVEHWGLLKRETFIAIWIVIVACLFIYLMGWFNYKRTENVKTVFFSTRKLFAVFVLAFGIYLMTGILSPEKNKLALLSGFPPPTSYGVFAAGSNENKTDVVPQVRNDLEKAIALAKQSNKPLLVDFTGWACVNCRKMEELVWTGDGVRTMINENYILVSLYVDDRKKLPTGETVGNKWARFQSENFKQASQPLYVLLSPEQELLNHPIGYTPDETTYEAWLQCGLDAYEQKKKLVAVN